MKTEELQVTALSRAVERSSSGQPTAKLLSEVVAELMADETPAKPSKPSHKQLVSDTLVRLRTSVAANDPLEQIDGLITELEKLLKLDLPRLRNAARSIPEIGCEDDEEIVQDATLMAARMIDAAEKSGKQITAGNASYYAIKAARSGRRSYYTGRSYVMSPGCQTDGKARHD